MAPNDAAAAASLIATSPRALARTKVEKELGLAHREHPAPRRDSLVGGVIYALAAVVALWPYILWNVPVALVVSLVSAGVAVATLAAVRALVLRVPFRRNGAEAAQSGRAACRERVGQTWLTSGGH